MTSAIAIDPSKVEAKAEAAFGYLTGAIVSGMIYLGDRMGLYLTLKDAGPVTSESLALRTGLSERWLREWLQGQAAAGIVDHLGEGRFELSPEAALVYADENNAASSVGAFDSLPAQLVVLERLPAAFQSGIGLSYDEDGPGTASSIERMLGPWNRTSLISEALPALDGVVAKLEAGAHVADVGCGGGVALVAMAKRFPRSQFQGYDNSAHALARAQAHLREAEVANLSFHFAESDRLPARPTFDLVTCLDCLHDMTHPERAAAAIRGALKADGTWFIVDVDGAETLEENLANPLAPLMYGYSVLTCMSSSLSEPTGQGLGTLGLPEPRMRELVLGAGFRSFRRVPGLEHPFNAYYEARP